MGIPIGNKSVIWTDGTPPVQVVKRNGVWAVVYHDEVLFLARTRKECLAWGVSHATSPVKAAA